jgi:hypothetical protein
MNVTDRFGSQGAWLLIQNGSGTWATDLSPASWPLGQRICAEKLQAAGIS